MRVMFSFAFSFSYPKFSGIILSGLEMYSPCVKPNSIPQKVAFFLIPAKTQTKLLSFLLEKLIPTFSWEAE